jgi:hypothetical protein
MPWIESAAGIATTKAGAGLLGGLFGGIMANLLRPPMKVKLINGQAMKDEGGNVVKEYDKVTARNVFIGASLLGFSGAIVVDAYFKLAFSSLEIFAMSIPLGAILVYLMTWALNTIDHRKNTDLIDAAVDLKEKMK